MIRQRPTGTAPAVQATAEALPLRTGAIDAALAVLTVHHWSNIAAGIAEMQRVARRRVIILTWDHDVIQNFWLLRDYVPAAAETDARLAVPINDLISMLGRDTVTVVTVPVPHAYLDDTVQRGMSLFSMTPKDQVEEGLTRLRLDLSTGEWQRRHGDLLAKPELDLGYRLLISERS
jgi:SAM-dependent methyltransferase